MKSFSRINAFCCLSLMILLAACHTKDNRQTDAPAYHNPIVAPITAAIAQKPKDPELYYQRSRALIQVEAPKLARKDLQKAVSLDTNNLDYLFSLGSVDIRLNKNKEAVGVLKKILQKNTHAAPARLLIAKAYKSDGQYEAATKEVQRLLRQDSAYPGALYSFAQIALAQKDSQKAMNALRAALRLRTDNYSASLLLAQCLAAKHKPAAVAQYRKTFDMDTTNVAAILYLGKYYEQEKMFQKAKATYYECLIKNPHCTQALLNMGYLLLDQDSVKAALRQFEIAIQTKPNSATAYYQKGFCLERLGRPESARDAYAQALVFQPDNAKIKNAWKRVRGK